MRPIHARLQPRKIFLSLKSASLRVSFAVSIAGLVLGLALGTVGLSGCSFAPSGGASSTAGGNGESTARGDRLYEEAWNMIRAEYVDSSFNGQDWNRWRTRFKGLIKDPEDAYVAVATMVASLNDEYTRFLPPRDMREQNLNIDSRLYGVGIQISMRDNKLVVLATIDDTPAEKAGLLPQDLIIRINGHETAGMSVEDAADRIRGPRDTQVQLTVQRGGRTLNFNIRRAEIRLKSVFTRPLSDNRIGYIRLSSFISESMLGEMEAIMRGMTDKQALIIDLRGNYGGLFANAVEIADMFLDKGEIVSIVNREQDRRVYRAHPGRAFRAPMVVLIDGGSASASEILGGALKDNRRATLIGAQSFGKGLVQKINALPEGAGLNITISRYLTPNGTDINKKGIEPDVKVAFGEADFHARRDPQLDKAVDYLKSRLVRPDVART
jgi:carboxyl-terminal processing protease